MEKIKLYVKDQERCRLSFRTERAIELFNKISDGLKTLAIKYTEDEVKELCSLNPKSVQKFVEEKFKNENKFLSKITIEEMYEQVEGLISALSSPLLNDEYSFDFAQIREGRATIKENAYKEIIEKATVYLTEPKEIEFYKEYIDWINKGNEIKNKFSQFISVEYLFTVIEETFHPNNHLPFKTKNNVTEA